jgi:hypothetical protein
MKKFAILAVLGLTLSVSAQTKATAPAPSPAPKPAPSTTAARFQTLPLGITAVGYDKTHEQVTARIGLTENTAADLGLGFAYNDAAPAGSEKLTLKASGFYLLKLQDWGVVDNHLAVGGMLSLLANGDMGLALFAGLQPEVTLFDRLILSIRCGGEIAVSPDVVVQTAGQGVSVVNALNFKIIW